MEMTCKDCKWCFGKDQNRMFCGRHAPIVIKNPSYSETSDQRVYLTLQPEVANDLYCGDFEPRGIEEPINED